MALLFLHKMEKSSLGVVVLVMPIYPETEYTPPVSYPPFTNPLVFWTVKADSSVELDHSMKVYLLLRSIPLKVSYRRRVKLAQFWRKKIEYKKAVVQLVMEILMIRMPYKPPSTLMSTLAELSTSQLEHTFSSKL